MTREMGPNPYIRRAPQHMALGPGVEGQVWHRTARHPVSHWSQVLPLGPHSQGSLQKGGVFESGAVSSKRESRTQGKELILVPWEFRRAWRGAGVLSLAAAAGFSQGHPEVSSASMGELGVGPAAPAGRSVTDKC